MYRIGPEMEMEAAKIIHKYIREGIIRESKSPWRSPIVMEPKKNGEYRLCIDYRRLNSVTVKDAYPMPRVDEILESMGGAVIFSKLDALSGYHQIKMREEDIEKTAFACREGLFEFLRMPFGLSNGLATFQRGMNRILGRFLYKCAMVYMDDIIIFSRCEEEHRRHIVEVLSELKKAGLKLNKDKCEFGKKKMEVLGHIINKDGISIDPAREQAIQNMRVPRDRKEMESFLGTINYCGKFVQDVTKDTAYLYGLMRKKANYDWSKAGEDERLISAVQALKDRVGDARTLAVPRGTGIFIITTDASDLGIVAIFSQEQDGVERIISYYSKAERNYSTTEKELLG
ncbi:Retrovirus-related Pol polyprotein from transposon opus [Nosema granulosis]|uniref:Retrovirus-related Pol polyprotein from transposon opus n=1 Tax=Nosema granulosis TaxID=83296 RepID=A0A9P6KZ28_9MICR|nr:Retrovirus-related Pol polyprotein from transposon opus [Nosema granulosis]